MKQHPLVWLVLALAAQVHSQSGPAPGFRLFGPLHGTSTSLLDNRGRVVHCWPGKQLPGLGVYLLDDGSLLRAVASAPAVPGLNGGGGGIQRVAFDGTLLWDCGLTTPGLLSHHDIAPLPNGNVLVLVWEDRTAAEAIAAGRQPALINGPVFRPDGVYEIRPAGPTAGQVVWCWRVWDHLIQDFDPTKANFGDVAAHPGRVDVNFPPVASEAFDWNHMNGIDYDPVHDWIVVSAPRQNEIWIIDHGTTIAEAAGSTGGRRGRGGELLYRWGNPAAYRAGPAAHQQLFFQHDPRFVRPAHPGAGHLTVFNNQFVAGNSAVVELVLPLDQTGNFVLGPNGRYGPVTPLWNYTDNGFVSPFVSSAERLPNGNTLICSGTQGRVFEVTSSGESVWESATSDLDWVFQAQYVERTLWASASSISASAGGTVALDLVAGSAFEHHWYVVLGSISGTSPGIDWAGLHVPLNPDLFTALTFGGVNSAMFVNTWAVLDDYGRARAQIEVRPGVVPPALVGLHMDFGYLAADPTDGRLVMASSTVPVVLTP